MINLLIQFPELKQFDLTSLEALAYGGSPMAPELIRRVREVLPHVKLVQGYGLSETGFLSGLQDHEHTQTRLMSCGRTCPGIDMRVVDELGREVEAGQHGELVARGANVMRAYWSNAQETSRAFQNGMFRTGDVGYRDADGYFYILDRLKDMIVTGGETSTPARSKPSSTSIRRFSKRRSSAYPTRTGASSSRPALYGSRDKLLAQTN
jgi:long-chain acyl-CoA synthetase